jgi:hypothetical protein
MLLLMGELIYLDISCFDGTLVARKVMITEASPKERRKGQAFLQGGINFFLTNSCYSMYTFGLIDFDKGFGRKLKQGFLPRACT